MSKQPLYKITENKIFGAVTMKDQHPPDHTRSKAHSEAHRTAIRGAKIHQADGPDRVKTRVVSKQQKVTSEEGASSPETLVSQTLNHRFVLQAEIARGGMGVIYRALDLRRQEARDRDPFVAVKVISEAFLRHYQEAFVSLQRETKKAQQLAHPNIITVYDFDRDGDTVYMTMELLQGQSLRQLILQRAGKGMPLVQALPIIQGLCEGLKYAHHKGVVHSDIKPDNIFVTDQSEVKLLDFGIATAVYRSGEDASETVFNPRQLGALTMAYAALELFTASSADPRDDLYSLGCVSYELIAGVHPFGKKSTLESMRDKARPKPIKALTQRQWKTLQRALEFRREDRIETIEAFCQGLKPVKRGWMVPVVLLLLAVAVLSGLSLNFIGNPVALDETKPIDTAAEETQPVVSGGGQEVPSGTVVEENKLTLVASQSSYIAGDPLSFIVTVSQDSYLYCYYDNSKEVVRLFPNRFQSDASSLAGVSREIPGGGERRGFDITLDFPGVTEEIACFALPQDMAAQLPASLWSTDLMPLSVASLGEVVAVYQNLEPGLVMQRLSISVPVE